MKSKIEVLKFGGTSVGTPEIIKKTSEIVKKSNEKTIVVVSAFAGITNKLTEICKLLEELRYDKVPELYNDIFKLHRDYALELGAFESIKVIEQISLEQLELIKAIEVLNEISNKSKDSILYIGEFLSSTIIAEFYNNTIGATKFVDSKDWIISDSNFCSALVNYEQSKSQILSLSNQIFEEGYHNIVCGGFFASDIDGNRTTIGRGGSDHSAAIIAMGVNSETVKIYTDVTGIKTADPRICNDAETIESMTYDEAFELAESGAKVLHPKTILPAINSGIKVLVLNTNEPFEKGTLIIGDTNNFNNIKAVTNKIDLNNISIDRSFCEDITLMLILQIAEKYNIRIEVLDATKSQINIVYHKDIFAKEFESEVSELTLCRVFNDIAIVTLVGENIGRQNSLLAQIFDLLSNINIYHKLINDNSIKLLVHQTMSNELIKLIHKEIILKKY